MQEGGLHKMKENKQLSLFDIDNEEEKLSSLVNPENEEEQKNYNKAKNHYLKALAETISNEQEEEFRKEVRRKIYSIVYLFKDCFQIIDFLLKIEFEDHFKKWEFVSLLLELAFESLQKGNEVNSFDDIHKLYFKKYIAEFEENEALQNEYRIKIDKLFIKYHIEEQEKENFLKLIYKFIEAKETIIYYDELNEEDKQREESFLKRRYEDYIQEVSKDILQKEGIFPSISEKVNSSIEELKRTRQEIIQIIESKGITFFDSIIEEFAILQNKMYDDTYSSYYESNFLDIDYLEALKFVKAGLIKDSRAISKEENEEAKRINEYIEKGLPILKEFLASDPEDLKANDESNSNDFLITSKLQEELKDLQEKGENPERQEELKKLIRLIRKEEFESNFEEGFERTRKLPSKLLLNSQVGFNSFKNNSSFQVNEFNEIEVNYNFDLLDNKGNFLTEEYKPIVNAVLSWYEINGKTPFSLIQLYEVLYNKPYQNKSKENQENLKNLETALDEMRLLTMRIRFKEESISIDEETKETIKDIKEYKYFNYFLPMRKKEMKHTRQFISHGNIVEISNDSIYQIIDIPPIYEYSRHFDSIDNPSGTLLSYKVEDYLNGLKSLPTNPKNKLIIENLLHRIILMKQGKIKSNQINYASFFEDYCGIDYSLYLKKSKEVLRKKIKTILEGFKKDKIIINYKEYTAKNENQKSKTGIEVFF